MHGHRLVLALAVAADFWLGWTVAWDGTLDWRTLRYCRSGGKLGVLKGLPSRQGPLFRVVPHEPVFPTASLMIRSRNVLPAGFNWCGIYRVLITFCRVPSILSF
jgi:hypothetical protein